MLSDENENNFRDFSNALLAAEETVHRSGVALYSPEALQQILSTFCGIVARDIEAQSCTIHLKLHDIGSCKFIEKLTEEPGTGSIGPANGGDRTPEELKEIERHREEVARSFQKTWTDAKGILRRPDPSIRYARDDAGRRDSILRGANAFPHCIYPKGAMWLVAANETSPWLPFVGWLITELSSGVTAEIVQEKSARVRDPFNIRKTRAYRKLGEVDPYVWTNKRPTGTFENASPRFFFNYYAVPIRIHSGGDVIGIIKIENKGFAYDAGPAKCLHEALNNILKTPHKSGDLDGQLSALAEVFKAAATAVVECKFEPRDPSLLSLVYLAYDLSLSSPSTDGTIEPLLTECFSANDPVSPAPDLRPPIQIFFDSIPDERKFLNWIGGSDADDAALSAARDVYVHLNDALSGSSRPLRLKIENALDAFLKDRRLEGSVSAGLVDDGVLRRGVLRKPDFLYKVSITDAKEPFQFHVQVCPSERESANRRILEQHWGLRVDRAGEYTRLAKRQKQIPPLSGEYFRGKERIIHLRTDRFAARVHALAYAFPVPSFSFADSWKLSWAALEIGKLIERQISYRGTHVAPTVPLTADDFFRIPISDLSFVDAVRRQYDSARAAEDALRYHLPNLCRDLGLTWGITHGSRVKELRSYFDRIGQTHRAYHDALLALWSYILVRRLTEEELATLRARKNTARLAELLEKLEKEIDGFLAGTPLDNWKQRLGDWLDEDVYPDMRFAAPPFRIDRKQVKPALDLLRKNLSACPTGLHLSDPPDVEDLLELLYRRYDAFIVFAVSLYLQLESEQRREGYLDFYEATRQILDDLRKRLEALEQEGTSTPGRIPAGGISATLGELRVEVLSLSTLKLAGDLDEGTPDTTDLLRFSVHGIYKRIRTLANVSGNQTPPAMLNWESGRFDYLGSRITCLFKNQVFAIYEQLWNRGDPFRSWTVDGSTARQRWLCLRTKVHIGNEGYHAWQISALMDAHAVGENYWDANAFTLNALREILSAAYRRWHNDADAYKTLGDTRASLRKQYCEWFADATDVLDRQSVPVRPDRFFGKYLAETALDLLVHLLRLDARLVEWKSLIGVVDALKDFADKACDYSNVVVMPIMRGQLPGTFAPADNKLLTAANDLYKKIEDLAARSALPGVDESLTQMRKEKEDFEIYAGTAKAPIIFMTAALAEKIKDLWVWLAGSKKSLDNTRSGCVRLEDLVREIQASQMDFLFQLTAGGDAPPLRSEAEVMERIICYILLHDPTAYDHHLLSHDQTRAVETAPDAYNLFYYAMSLVPIELQVRTALANTMAEQYHKIYKIGPEALTTRIQQERLKGIGHELDMMDREFEVQFEDYIHKRNG